MTASNGSSRSVERGDEEVGALSFLGGEGSGSLAIEGSLHRTQVHGLDQSQERNVCARNRCNQGHFEKEFKVTTPRPVLG